MAKIYYDPNADYQPDIDRSAAKGDYNSAVMFEKMRNAQIAGEAKSEKQTFNYYKPDNSGSVISASNPAYDPNTDYQALIEKSAASGDLKSAAMFEKMRNAKIKNEGLSYSETHIYSKDDADDKDFGLPGTSSEGLSPAAAATKAAYMDAYEQKRKKEIENAYNKAISAGQVQKNSAAGQSALSAQRFYNNAAATGLNSGAVMQEDAARGNVLQSIYNQLDDNVKAQIKALMNQYGYSETSAAQGGVSGTAGVAQSTYAPADSETNPTGVVNSMGSTNTLSTNPINSGGGSSNILNIQNPLANIGKMGYNANKGSVSNFVINLPSYSGTFADGKSGTPSGVQNSSNTSGSDGEKLRDYLDDYDFDLGSIIYDGTNTYIKKKNGNVLYKVIVPDSAGVTWEDGYRYIKEPSQIECKALTPDEAVNVVNKNYLNQIIQALGQKYPGLLKEYLGLDADNLVPLTIDEKSWETDKSYNDLSWYFEQMLGLSGLSPEKLTPILQQYAEAAANGTLFAENSNFVARYNLNKIASGNPGLFNNYTNLPLNNIGNDPALNTALWDFMDKYGLTDEYSSTDDSQKGSTLYNWLQQAADPNGSLKPPAKVIDGESVQAAFQKVPDKGNYDGSKNGLQCVDLTRWYVDTYTTLTSTPGDGDELVANIAAANNVQTSTTPRANSIFSIGPGSAGLGYGGSTDGGHTGIILSVDEKNHTVTILHTLYDYENDEIRSGIKTVPYPETGATYLYLGDYMKK